MKYIFAFLSFLSSTVFAGGGIGGGGLGKESQLELTLLFADNAGLTQKIDVPDLGLEPKPVSEDIYRRARMRLSNQPMASVSVGGRDIDFKSLSGGIVDISETSQLVIQK